MKVSDYIKNNDWFSFVEESVCNCPSSKFPTLLKEYLKMGDSYNLKLHSGHTIKIFELLAKPKNVAQYDQEKMAITLIRTPFNPNYCWSNGLIFLNVMSKKIPNLFQHFVDSPNFAEQITKIIQNNNADLIFKKLESEEFNLFMNNVIMHLNKEQFNEFYERNHLYITDQTTPNLKKILDSYKLENELGLKEENLNKPKSKI